MNGPHDAADEDLWRLAGEDPQAFGQLFERHARSVYAFCVWRTGDAALAEDLTSTVFLEAWRKRSTVTLTGHSALPYLLGVANNVSRNAARSLRRYRKALGRLPPGSHAQSAEEDAVARGDAARGLEEARRALVVLTEPEREVLVLVAWSGLSYDEAALALGVPVGTVRSRLSRARQKLQHELARPSAVTIALPVLDPTPSIAKDPS